jgi:hypothetical protein
MDSRSGKANQQLWKADRRWYFMMLDVITFRQETEVELQTYLSAVINI